MNAREQIIGVLGGLARRLRMASLIRETAFAACVVLFGIVCLQLIEPAQGQAPWLAVLLDWLKPAVALAIGTEAVSRGARRVELTRAAAYADAQAQLEDELKSARCFLLKSRLSAIEELQVQRAAVTAAGLDLPKLVPSRWRGNVVAPAALAVALVALSWMQPELSPSQELQRAAIYANPGSADPRLLLRNAPPREEIARLDTALGTLQREDASAEDKVRALADARDAIEQANMEAAAAREDLARLAQSLKTQPGFEQAGRAIGNAATSEAMTLLQALKSDASTSSPGPLTKPAAGTRARETLAPAAPEADRSSAQNQPALDRAIATLRHATERIAVQARVNNVRRLMESNLVASAERARVGASRFDSRIDAAHPTPSPQAGEASMPGGALFRQDAAGGPGDDESRNGSRTGDPSGEAPALPLKGESLQRLDAQLRLETILRQEQASGAADGKGDAGWFYSASQEQKSVLPEEPMQVEVIHQREAALQRNGVAMRQKDIVKKYFVNLHESPTP